MEDVVICPIIDIFSENIYDEKLPDKATVTKKIKWFRKNKNWSFVDKENDVNCIANDI